MNTPQGGGVASLHLEVTFGFGIPQSPHLEGLHFLLFFYFLNLFCSTSTTSTSVQDLLLSSGWRTTSVNCCLLLIYIFTYKYWVVLTHHTSHLNQTEAASVQMQSYLCTHVFCTLWANLCPLIVIMRYLWCAFQNL